MKKTGHTLGILAFLVLFIFSCSDGNSSYNTAEKESAGKTNDDHDLVVFNRGDLDEILFKIDTVYITDTSFLGRLYFRNLPESKTPEPGDIINSSVTKKTPYGFLYRVTEVAMEAENVTIVSVSYASIAEAVEEADIEFEIPLVYDDEEEPARQILARSWWRKVVNTVVKVVNTIVDALAGNWDVGGTNGTTFSVSKGASFGNSRNGGNVNLNGSYTLALTTRIKLKHYSLDYAKMSVAQTKRLVLEGNLKGSVTRKEDFELASYRLPDIEFMVGPVFVYLKNEAIVKAKVEAAVQANINAKLTFNEFSEYGFEYDGGFKRINTCDRDFYYDYKHSAYGSVRFGVLVGFNSLFYGVAGVQLSAGPSLELTSPLIPLTVNSKTTLSRDLDVDVKIKLQFLDFLSKSWDFGSVRLSLGSFPSSNTLPSFNFKRSDFNLSGIAGGKLSFPFKIDRSDFGFSVENSGFCIEDREGECIKGPGLGLGKFGKVSGSVISFEGLGSGTYNIIPYFESSDGEIHFDMSGALMYFVVDSYCNDATYDPKTQFCSLQEIKVYSLCGGKDYNTLTQFCSSQLVYDLCAGNSYYPSMYFCFNNALYELCSGISYNPSTQFCFSQRVYDLCGGNSYSPSTHFCFGNALYDLCGGSSYNPSTHFCFNKTAYFKCGGKTYDPLEEGCCGTTIFNSQMQKCSGSEIVAKEFVNDEQGQRYGYVKIGEQYWLSENMNYNAPGSRCYDDDPVNCRIYGRLYDWAAAMALPDSCNTHSCASQIKSPHQGICPSGWHIPTLVEWNKLLLLANGYDSYFYSLNYKLLSTSSLWNYDGSGTDNFGFSALPGGEFNGESYSSIRSSCWFWTATEGAVSGSDGSIYENDKPYNAVYETNLTSRGGKYGYRKTYAFSIRCVKD